MNKLHLLFLFAISLATNGFDVNLDEPWKIFKDTFNKNYGQDEELKRRPIWEHHIVKILHHNLKADLGILNYTVGINKYADMTTEEFTKTMNGFRGRNMGCHASEVFTAQDNVAIPEAVDWRKEGMVTPVKDQGVCGDCWAFSATGALEGQHKKKTGKLVSLSEQNLVDCSSAQGNTGCKGGMPSLAFTYVSKNQGIDTETAYPYTGKDGTCHYKAGDKGATCTGFTEVKPTDELALRKDVATVGPMSVAIDASHWSFQMYRHGVYNDQSCSPSKLNRAVLLVGYGTEDGQDYWLVKNSLGGSWGEKGYVRMIRNKGNHCGIATMATYPNIK